MKLPPSETSQGSAPQGTAPQGAAPGVGLDDLTTDDIRMAVQIVRVGKLVPCCLLQVCLTVHTAHIINQLRRSSGDTALNTLTALLDVLPSPSDIIQTMPNPDVAGVDDEGEESMTTMAGSELDSDLEDPVEMINAVSPSSDSKSAIHCLFDTPSSGSSDWPRGRE